MLREKLKIVLKYNFMKKVHKLICWEKSGKLKIRRYFNFFSKVLNRVEMLRKKLKKELKCNFEKEVETRNMSWKSLNVEKKAEKKRCHFDFIFDFPTFVSEVENKSNVSSRLNVKNKVWMCMCE